MKYCVKLTIGGEENYLVDDDILGGEVVVNVNMNNAAYYPSEEMLISRLIAKVNNLAMGRIAGFYEKLEILSVNEFGNSYIDINTEHKILKKVFERINGDTIFRIKAEFCKHRECKKIDGCPFESTCNPIMCTGNPNAYSIVTEKLINFMINYKG